MIHTISRRNFYYNVQLFTTASSYSTVPSTVQQRLVPESSRRWQQTCRSETEEGGGWSGGAKVSTCRFTPIWQRADGWMMQAGIREKLSLEWAAGVWIWEWEMKVGWLHPAWEPQQEHLTGKHDHPDLPIIPERAWGQHHVQPCDPTLEIICNWFHIFHQKIVFKKKKKQGNKLFN